MKTLLRIAGEATAGFTLGIGMRPEAVEPTIVPAHVALVHDVIQRTVAPPAHIEVPMNRAERRALGIIEPVVYAPVASPVLTQLQEDLANARARTRMHDHHELMRRARY